MISIYGTKLNLCIKNLTRSCTFLRQMDHPQNTSRIMEKFHQDGNANRRWNLEESEQKELQE